MPRKKEIAISVSALVIAMCGLVMGTSAVAADRMRQGNLKSGQALYQHYCLRCHGARLDGNGPEASKLRGKPTDFRKYLSRVKGDLELEVAIRQGRTLTAMHEWDSLLTDEQISDLVGYIRSAVPHLEVKP